MRLVLAVVVADEHLGDPGPEVRGDAVEHVGQRRCGVVRDDQDADPFRSQSAPPAMDEEDNATPLDSPKVLRAAHSAGAAAVSGAYSPQEKLGTKPSPPAPKHALDPSQLVAVR